MGRRLHCPHLSGAGKGRVLARRVRPRPQSPGRATRYKAAGNNAPASRAPAPIPGASGPSCASEDGDAREGGALLSAGRALGGAHVPVCGLPGCPEPAGSRSAPGGGLRERGEATGSREAGCRLPPGHHAPPPGPAGPWELRSGRRWQSLL